MSHSARANLNPFQLAHDYTLRACIHQATSVSASEKALTDLGASMARTESFAREHLNLTDIEHQQQGACRRAVQVLCERLNIPAETLPAFDTLLEDAFLATADVYARSGYLLGMSAASILPAVRSLRAKPSGNAATAPLRIVAKTARRRAR